MSKTTNGVTTSFILDGADVVAEIKGDEITIYSRGLGLISKTKGTITKTYFSDSHGDITGLYSSATDGEEAIYDGFGNTLFNDSSDNPFGYCGEYTDLSSGLIYLRNRYYDPSIGRFISEDTHWNPNNMIYGDKKYRIGEIKIPDVNAIIQSSNLYAYCMNNPMNFVDPSGEEGVAAAMLYHAFFGNGEFQDYSYNTMFLTTFNSSVVLRNKIDEKLAEFKKSGLSTNTITGDDLVLYGKSNLNDYDLSFAVGKANYTMTFNKVEKNKSFLFWDWKETNYNVTVTITDVYNFDEYRDSKSIGAVLNNLGYDIQKAGQIKPFEWKITFTVKGLE